tara:strand:- start:1184 stop:1330 length:147 start_codon:yes stop_codon:yes gene_type:complete
MAAKKKQGAPSDVKEVQEWNKKIRARMEAAREAAKNASSTSKDTRHNG